MANETMMVRANITPEEWKALRRRALDADQSAADYLGDLIRKEIEGAPAVSPMTAAGAPRGG